MRDPDTLAELVHELRSPVAALRAIEETLAGARDALAPDELRRLLLVAVAAGRDIDRLLSDPDLLSLRREPVDLAAVADAVRGDRVEVSVEEGLVVDADAGRLRQVLGNLVENGLRHGGRVRVEGVAHDAEVWVTVTDDGPGVADGLDPFERGASTEGSTGLGLYVARALAEAHGGRLELLPADGAGARFRLALPRAGGASG